MKTSLLVFALLLTFPVVSAQTITSKPSRYGPVREGYFKGAEGVRLFYRKVGKGKDAVVSITSHGFLKLRMAEFENSNSAIRIASQLSLGF